MRRLCGWEEGRCTDRLRLWGELVQSQFRPYQRIDKDYAAYSLPTESCQPYELRGIDGRAPARETKCEGEIRLPGRRNISPSAMVMSLYDPPSTEYARRDSVVECRSGEQMVSSITFKVIEPLT